jgi:hypothetical protein
VGGLIDYNKYKMSLTIPAGKKIFFELKNSRSGLPNTPAMLVCRIYGGFIPEPAMNYEIRLDGDASTRLCTLEILRIETSKNGESHTVAEPSGQGLPAMRKERLRKSN